MPFKRQPFTGFPFDDRIPPPTDHPTSSSSSHTPPASSHHRGGDDSRLRFEDHLRDIATRYPEFAEHIRSDRGSGGDRFPRERVRRDPWGRDEFDFGREFDIPREFEGRFARPREFYPPNTQTYSTSPPFPSESRPPVYPSPPQAAAKAPQQTPPPQPTTTKPASATVIPAQAVGIQQSNTVDLGQVQPQGSTEGTSDGRGQRSMSAPPTNGGTGGKRYVSSIQIPVLQQGGGAPQVVTQQQATAPTAQEMGTSNSAPKEVPQPPYRPNEYVIPIHIEGRDEPIIPKQSVPQQQYMQQPAAGAQNQPLFNTMKDQYKQQQEQIQREQQQKFYEQQKAQEELESQQQQQQQQKAQFVKPSPLEMIQLIQRDVSELMSKAEKFAGKTKDKEYIYLDEMLTRNLLKLDNIETEGKDAIRQARREAIKCIEGCISNLEAKANQNALLAIEDTLNSGVQKSSSSGSTKAEVGGETALVADKT